MSPPGLGDGDMGGGGGGPGTSGVPSSSRSGGHGCASTSAGCNSVGGGACGAGSGGGTRGGGSGGGVGESAAGGVIAHHDLENLESCSRNPLLCLICNNIYEDPRLLACYHSFCAKCLQGRIGETKLICPLCGYVNSFLFFVLLLTFFYCLFASSVLYV